MITIKLHPSECSPHVYGLDRIAIFRDNSALFVVDSIFHDFKRIPEKGEESIVHRGKQEDAEHDARGTFGLIRSTSVSGQLPNYPSPNRTTVN